MENNANDTEKGAGPCTGTGLADLPQEILLQISSHLDLSALNALSQLNQSTYSLLTSSLYKLDAQQSSRALCWASIHNHAPIATASISAGADVTTVSDQDALIKGCTPLMLAAYHGSLSVLNILLAQFETNPNSRDRKYIRPPITWAIKHRHGAVVRALLKDDRTDPNLQDKFGDTALMTAVTLRPDMIPVLLSGSRVDPRVSNTQGATALSRASQKGIEVDLILASHLRFILDGDESPAHCQHVFFYAAISGQLEIVEYLVTYFGDRLDPNGNAGAGHGRGAFSIAVERGHRRVVQFLLSWEKTDPNLTDSWMHQCPLLVAALDGDHDMVAILKDCQRVDLLNPDVSGTTPLHAAVERNHALVVKILLAGPRAADVNARNASGQTPLFMAILQDYPDLLRVLLEAGADPAITCAEGFTALDQGVQWRRDGRATLALREYMQKL